MKRTRQFGLLHQGMGPAFDQGEGSQGLPRDEPFVAEPDEPVIDVGGFQAEVLGIELLEAAPVADADVAQDSPAAHGLEELVGLVVGHSR